MKTKNIESRVEFFENGDRREACPALEAAATFENTD
jgi:hypothetical protein